MANLLHFSEAAALALHAMGHLAVETVEAAPDETVLSARQLAKLCCASETHMIKVCQRLARRGWLRAKRGSGGGFALARKPAAIRLIDVYVAIEGPVRLRNCLYRDRNCRGRNGHECVFGRHVRKLEQSFWDYLKGTTLAAIARECRREATR